jgi:hypothetical protein
MRTSPPVAVIAVLVLSATAIVAQDKSTLHVQSIHKETSEEHVADKASAVQYLKLVGTFEGKTYTLEAMDAPCNEVLEAGKDYPATLTQKKNDLIIESTFKGRPQKTRWRILAVGEVSAGDFNGERSCAPGRIPSTTVAACTSTES